MHLSFEFLDPVTNYQKIADLEIEMLKIQEQMNIQQQQLQYLLDSSPVAVRELADALNARSSAVVEHLGEITEWVVDQTAVAADDLDALSLPLLFSRTRDLVACAVEAWFIAVAEAHPAYTRTMRGHNPPQFLMERARIDAVVARVARRRAEAARDGGFAS